MYMSNEETDKNTAPVCVTCCDLGKENQNSEELK